MMTVDKDFATLEKEGWAEPATAQAYARDFARAAEQVVPTLIGAARVTAGCRALDLCCGHGIVAEGMVRAGARVIGVDFSEAMLDLARDRVPTAEFKKGDAMALRLDAGRFEAVCIGFGIPHVPDPPAVFGEARRVLRQDGWLAYSVWQGDGDSALAYVFEAIAQYGDPTIELPPGPGAHDFADPDRAWPALSEAGFADMSVTTVDSRWQIDDPGTPFDFFLTGTVRGGALLRPQSNDRKARIREAVARRVREQHGDDGPWSVPIPAVVIAARAV